MLDAWIANVQPGSDGDEIPVETQLLCGREHQGWAQVHRELSRRRFRLPDARHAGRNDLNVAGNLKPSQFLAVAASRYQQGLADLHADVVPNELLLGKSSGRFVQHCLEAVPMTPRAARSSAKDHLAILAAAPRTLLPHVELEITRKGGRT